MDFDVFSLGRIRKLKLECVATSYFDDIPSWQRLKVTKTPG